MSICFAVSKGICHYVCNASKLRHHKQIRIELSLGLLITLESALDDESVRP